MDKALLKSQQAWIRAELERCADFWIKNGWDKEHGGMILALDIDGKTPIFWGKPTYKPWWVQVETLVATVAAYRHASQPMFGVQYLPTTPAGADDTSNFYNRLIQTIKDVKAGKYNA